MHVCSAETNPFIVALTALFELEHVSKICKPKNPDVKNYLWIYIMHKLNIYSKTKLILGKIRILLH